MSVEYRYLPNIYGVTKDTFKAWYDVNLTSVERSTSLKDIEAGTVVGVFEDNILKDVVIIPAFSDVKYVDITNINVRGKIVDFMFAYKNIYTVRSYVTYDDYVLLVKKFINEGYLIDNFIHVNVSIRQSNLMRDSNRDFHGFKMYECNGYFKSSNKFTDIFDEHIVTLIKDNNAKYVIDTALAKAKIDIQAFLQSQKSQDNVSNYENVLASLHFL